MLRITLKRAGLGFLAGVAVGNVMTALMAYPDILPHLLAEKVGSASAAFLLQTLLTGVLGAVSFAGVGFYDVERWPLSLAAVVHYAVIEAVYIPIGFCLGWFERAGEALVWLAICAAVYLIIFFILRLVYRRQVRELNELNDQRKQHDGTTGNGGTK